MNLIDLLGSVEWGTMFWSISEKIKLRTRKGIGKEEIDRLRAYVKSDEFKQLDRKEIANIYNEFRNKANFKEFLYNCDILATLIMNISDNNVFWGFYDEIEINKKLFPYFINELKKQLEKISGNYENEKLQGLISVIIRTMRAFNIPDSYKLKYIEDNFEYLSQNSLFLACLYNYFTVEKQVQMESHLFNGEKIERRFDELNKKVKLSIKKSSLAKSIAWRSLPARKLTLNVEIDKDDKQLQEKINILRKLGRNYAIEFFNDKKIIETLSIEQITRLSLDKGVVKNLEVITNDEKGLAFVKALLLRPNVTEELPDFLKNINNYSEFIRSISAQDLENSKLIEKILNIIIQDRDNAFNVKSLEDIKAYNEIRTKKCLEILSANTSETHSVFVSDELTGKTSKNAISQKREALYYLFFGLSGTQVENLVKKYGEDVFRPEMLTDSMTVKDAKTLEIMRTLRRLYEAKDVDKISRRVLEDKDLIERLKREDIKVNYASLETSMIDFYNNRFNEVLYDPTKSTVKREVIYEGQPSRVPVMNFLARIIMKNKNYYRMSKLRGNAGIELGLFGRKKAFLFPDDSAKNRKVKIYEVDPKKPFNILARVEGAYFGYQEPYDFSRDKQFDLSYHGNCKSFIANDLLALAMVREDSGPIFGYSQGQTQELLMMAPWDIGSNVLNRQFAPHRFSWNSQAGIQFRHPKIMKDYTRHNHNEFVYDRLSYDEVQKNFKRDKPQYVIYVKEFDQNTIIENQRWKELVRKYGVPINTPMQQRVDVLTDLSKKIGEPLEELIYDDKYRQSVKAAAQYNIPLVILDRNKIIKNEFEKLNKSIEDFKQLEDPAKLTQMIPELITTFENNAVGTRFISTTMFGDEARVALYNVIKDKIKVLENNEGEGLEKVFEDTLIAERQKQITNKGGRIRYKIPKAMQMELKQIDMKKSKEFSEKEVPKMVREISKTNFYEGNRSHSIEHIQKTMILADKIATARNLPVEIKRLLVVSAAFHDSGRGKDKDGNDVHGIASAKKIQEYFEANPNNPFGITEDNLHILQAAIEYHEVNDKDKQKALSEFRRIANKYGIQVLIGGSKCKGFSLLYNDQSFISEFKLLEEIAMDLKDADALDRFRFAHGGRLKPEYLRTEQAKSLIGFANVLNAKYATKVLEDIYHATSEELKGHRKVSSLKFFRERKCKENPNYIEPHIDVDTLLKYVYGYSAENNNFELPSHENKITFEKRRNLSNYEDLTPTYVNKFLQRISRVANYIRGEKIEEEVNI